MAAQTINIEVDHDLNSATAGQINVETSGFKGKGCDAIHAAFSSGNGVKKNVKKPEYKAVQQQHQVAR